MIVQVIYLEDYDWLIKVYYAVTTYYTEQILGELESMDCAYSIYNDAEKMLKEGKLNCGFTYTNPSLHVTFIIIGLTDSVQEFVNTYDHEKGHAATHIGEFYDMDPYGENFQYLQGKIGQEMFTIAKQFMCEHCRKNFVVNFINNGKMKIKFKD